MANYQQIGDILGGMAAGLSGDAAGWQRNMMAREEMANQRAEREQEKAYVMQQRQQQAQQQEQERAIARMKTMFSDGAAAYKMAYANDWNGVVKLAQHRLEMSKHFPGVDFSDTARIGELAARAAQGDQEAARSAMGELQQLVDVGRAQGLIAPPEEKSERGVVYMYDPLTGKRQAKAIEGAKEAMAQAGAGDQSAYYQALPTTEGYAAFNARTGQASPIMSGGKAVMPANFDPSLQRQIAESKAAGAAVGGAQGEAQAGLTNTLAKAQQTLDVIDLAIKHPGREAATGASSVFNPANYVAGTQAKDFQAIAAQLQGKAFLEAFQSLKGGGAITQIEGEKATAAIAALDRAQSDEQYLSALNQLRAIVMDGMAKAKKLAGVQEPNSQPQQQPQQATKPRMKFNPATGMLE